MYWDLTQNNEFDGQRPINRDLRSLEYGSNLNFYSSDTTNPSIPTSGGWVHPYVSSWYAYMSTEFFEFGYHQFTIMVDLFPVQNPYNFYMYIIKYDGDPAPIIVKFNTYVTIIYYPTTSNTAIKLTPRRWNRVRHFS